MQDEKKEFDDEQMHRDNYAEFFSLVAAFCALNLYIFPLMKINKFKLIKPTITIVNTVMFCLIEICSTLDISFILRVNLHFFCTFRVKSEVEVEVVEM